MIITKRDVHSNPFSGFRHTPSRKSPLIWVILLRQELRPFIIIVHMSHLFVMHFIIHMFNTSVIPYISLEQYLNPKDHWRFGPYTPIFLIPRTLLLSFWCGACNVSAIGKSLLQNIFKIPKHSRVMAGRKRRESEGVWNFMTIKSALKSDFCTFSWFIW